MKNQVIIDETTTCRPFNKLPVSIECHVIQKSSSVKYWWYVKADVTPLTYLTSQRSQV
jgi:hypothetical protein